MKLGRSRGGTLVPALVAFLVLATVGAALAGTGTFGTRPDADATASDAPRSGHRDADHPSGGAGPSGSETDADDPAGDTGADDPAGCADAIRDGETALERAHGLERASDAIVANCERGHAQGLLNALARLQENQERRSEREHGTGPNEHANGNANGPGGEAHPHDTGAKDEDRPDAPGRSAPHANANAHASHSSSTH